MTKMNKKILILTFLAAISVLVTFFAENICNILGIPQHGGSLGQLSIFFLLVIFVIYFWVLKTETVKDHDEEIKT